MDSDSLATCNTRCCRRCAVWMLCVASVCCSGAIQGQGVDLQTADAQTYASHPRALAESPDVATRQSNPAASVKRSPTPAPGQKPAPARVVFEDGKLTVEADNSDLAEILTAVANVTGMTIDGNIRSSRVFGVYGPRSPRDVLTDLLEGSGYNFMMIGGTRDGAPRDLLLSAEKSKSTSEPPAVATRTQAPPDTSAHDQDQLGPGAIAHVPPPPPEDPQERVRQNLQRLRQMHEKLKEGNAPQ